MLRAIREIQPRWVVGENVPGLLNWGRGVVLDEIKADLEAAGFEVFPSLILPACGKNAPHKRDRLWIVAHSLNGGYKAGRGKKEETDGIQGIGRQAMDAREFNGAGLSSVVANTDTDERRERGLYEAGRKEAERYVSTCDALSYERRAWDDFPTQSPIRYGNDGLPDKLAALTLSKWRDESIKAMGNSIVPQVVYEIFKAIESI